MAVQNEDKAHKKAPQQEKSLRGFIVRHFAD